jgi:polar amino acid transport system permease protein
LPAQASTFRPRRAADPGHRWEVAAAAAGAAVLTAAALAAALVVSSPALQWPVVGRYLFSSFMLGGVATTVELTVASQALAVTVGVAIALLERSASPVAVWAARGYVWVFRSVPLLVQLLGWFNLALLVPVLRLPLPGGGLAVPTNAVISAGAAAVLGLGLHEASFMAEIIRGGIASVPRAQADAAMTDGLSRSQAMRRIVLPQALPGMIPAIGNQLTGTLKASALVSAIGGGDLLTRAELVYGETYQVIPLLAVATIWYLALVAAFSGMQRLLEARFAGWAP